jgi:hypothetical protein
MPAGFVEFAPFNVIRPLQTRNIRAPVMMMPLFSNNARVVYKEHSLALGTSGTVRNAGARARRT